MADTVAAAAIILGEQCFGGTTVVTSKPLFLIEILSLNTTRWGFFFSRNHNPGIFYHKTPTFKVIACTEHTGVVVISWFDISN
jgi:hypothetical protein